MTATSTPSKPLATATTRLSGLLSHFGVTPLAFDDTLALIDPLLTVHRLHARVVAVRAETPSSRTLVLELGRGFQMPQPGQYAMFGVVIQGVRHRRAYSPRVVNSRLRQIAITVQRQPGGLVSNHLNAHTRVGDVIEVEQPAGHFTLPSPAPMEVLMLAGGSGITPNMAMLEHLKANAPATRATLIYFARSAEERILAKALRELANAWPNLRYVPIDSVAHTPTSTSADAGHRPGPASGVSQRLLDQALLDEVCPNWAHLPAYCCGPAPLMDAARALWAQAGASNRLHLEAFAPPRAEGDPHARHAVRLTRDAIPQAFEAPGDQTLLVAGERAGLSIPHGCRQGICHECTCRLEQGSVKDLESGRQVDGEGQLIRLCVSSALSDLELTSMR
jgi:ferredoxin-NADP reductase